METTPPQQEIPSQADSSYEAAPAGFQTQPTFKMSWVLILVVALVAVWLWASWLRGWFPFSAQVSAPPERTMQQTQESILNSLTAPTVPHSMNGADVKATLKTLNPTPSSKTAPIDTTSVLDSLTPKK